MLWFIIFGTIGIVVAGIFFIREMGGYGVVPGILIGAIAGMVIGVLANVIALPFMGATRHVEAHDLQSIGAASGISGSFFLGIGTVDSTTEYHYFVKTADGGFQEKSIETDYATVYETDETPHLDITWDDPSNQWLGIFAAHMSDEHYNFYVPRGSVVQNYTLKP